MIINELSATRMATPPVRSVSRAPLPVYAEQQPSVLEMIHALQHMEPEMYDPLTLKISPEWEFWRTQVLGHNEEVEGDEDDKPTSTEVKVKSVYNLSKNLVGSAFHFDLLV